MKIRLATPLDASQIQSIYRPFVENTPITFEFDTPDISRLGIRIQTSLLYLVAEIGDTIVGYAYAAPHMDRPAYQYNALLSVYIAPAYSGKNIGKSLYRELITQLKEKGYRNLYGCITLPNPKSIHLHESLGFIPCGLFRETGYKLGKWHDVIWYELKL